MADNRIIINQQEFPLNYKLLRIIARMLPQEAHYAPLARAILTLNVPSITSELVSNDILTSSDLDAIWSTGDPELRQALVEESAFIENLTDAQADEIMASRDTKLHMGLASNIDVLFPEDYDPEDDDEEDDEKPRLSQSKAKQLLDFLANHEDAGVRRSFAENECLDPELKRPVREMLENGYAILPDHLAELKEADMPLLEKTTRENLMTIAEWVEAIKSKKIREKVAQMLARHPDPELRIALAENVKTPRAILELLAKDEEEEVSLAAKHNL